MAQRAFSCTHTLPCLVLYKVLMLSTQRSTYPLLVAAAPALSSVEGCQLDFMDYTTEEIAMLLRNVTEER
jgi:hypothetical protein